MSTRSGMNRRTFFLTAGTAVGGALVQRRAQASLVPPSERVRLGVIGCGGMGSRHIEALATNPECKVVALCDVAMSRFHRSLDKVEELTGERPDGFQDFYKILDRQDIDAIFIATPDHWHPLLAIMGCQAGKDVYVEKPMSPTVTEGRAMVNAARRYGRIMQAGTQQRSMPIFQKAMGLVHDGTLGRITSATAWVGTNGWNVGETEEPIPKGLDWDRWLGPAPYRPYSRQRYFGFMGWHDYARGGELTNWGTHLMDVVHWGIQQDTPLSIQALGGSYNGGAGSDNYETIEAVLEYPDCTVTWEQRLNNTHAGKGYGIMFQGTKGNLFVDRGTFKVRPGELGVEEYIGAPEKSWANTDHHNNFFDAIRTRKRPAAEIEQGHRSTSAVLLAGIALKVGRKLHWDGDNEQFIDDAQADRHLMRTYRGPWRL